MQEQHWETTSTTSPPCRDLTAEKLLPLLANVLGLPEYSKRLPSEINITKLKKDIMKLLKGFQKNTKWLLKAQEMPQGERIRN